MKQSIINQWRICQGRGNLKYTTITFNIICLIIIIEYLDKKHLFI